MKFTSAISLRFSNSSYTCIALVLIPLFLSLSVLCCKLFSFVWSFGDWVGVACTFGFRVFMSSVYDILLSDNEKTFQEDQEICSFR